ncbi:MAG TPA: hypothetical protein VMJ73_02235 [Rhizomicrobium sp.]|nr:hypothetical protein [Rhizomicrobium sp.]
MKILEKIRKRSARECRAGGAVVNRAGIANRQEIRGFFGCRPPVYFVTLHCSMTAGIVPPGVGVLPEE